MNVFNFVISQLEKRFSDELNDYISKEHAERRDRKIKEIEDRLFDAIEWKDGRSDKVKNMMIGDYIIKSNITHETFLEKRNLVFNEIISNIY